jgi:hypothetical protein
MFEHDGEVYPEKEGKERERANWQADCNIRNADMGDNN